MTISERNRAIKRTLETAFGRGKVTVRGSRGTAHGWVSVNIDWTPLDSDQSREMEALVWQLLTAAGLSQHIGSYGYDDPGSDYGFGTMMHLNFNAARYYRARRQSDGTLAVLREYGDCHWQTVEA